MGTSNRTTALERKISVLLGEQQKKLKDVEKAERLYAQVPDLRARIERIDDLVFYCEEIIKDDQPDWTPDKIKARKPFAHHIPIKLGSATKLALAVLRDAPEPMTIREIASEVLRREGVEVTDRSVVDRVCDTIGNQFRKRDRPYLENDGEWPAKWWVKKPE